MRRREHLNFQSPKLRQLNVRHAFYPPQALAQPLLRQPRLVPPAAWALGARRRERARLLALADWFGTYERDREFQATQVWVEAQGELCWDIAGAPFTLTAKADRIDKRADGTYRIIDYKTGDHLGDDIEKFLDDEQNRYYEQLNRYAAIMAQKEDNKIQLGLYFPLLKKWRYWEYQTKNMSK